MSEHWHVCNTHTHTNCQITKLQFKDHNCSRAWWCSPLIPALREAEEGGSPSSRPDWSIYSEFEESQSWRKHVEVTISVCERREKGRVFFLFKGLYTENHYSASLNWPTLISWEVSLASAYWHGISLHVTPVLIFSLARSLAYQLHPRRGRGKQFLREHTFS